MFDSLLQIKIFLNDIATEKPQTVTWCLLFLGNPAEQGYVSLDGHNLTENNNE